MIKFLLTIPLFIAVLFSSTYIVLDENENPLENVQIYNDFHGTISDKNGLFNLNEECYNYTLNHIGFQTVIINPCDETPKKIVLNKLSIANQEIIVLGDLGLSKLKNTISDIDIFTKTEIRNSNKTTLEDILQSSTNINYSGVSSRLRYFQIRGIGEYEQFAGQGGPNYYVGTLIDNFNFSGLGAPISMFDVEQVEIFKGAQSFTFGQNSMAGLIRINTARPKQFKESKFLLEIGNYNKKNIHILHNQPISENLSLRVGITKNNDDGFIYNNYLNDYSNKRDELISNLKLAWNNYFKNGNNLTILLNILDYNLDNNYDRWSSTNFNDFNNFISYSDFEGLSGNESKDALSGNSQSLEANYEKVGFYNFITIITADNITLNHSYDGDWSNPTHWGNYYYPFSQSEIRKRKSYSLESKILTSAKNNNFTIGFFIKNLEERDNANGFIFDLLNYTYISNFNSNYLVQYSSFYLQDYYKINEDSYLTLNIRQDNYKNEYQSISTVSDYYGNSNLTNNPQYNKKETILSGRIGLKLKKYYLSISRGHKAGGFNQNPFISESNRVYAPEYNNTLELGYKNTIGMLNIDINCFYMNREDLHVSIADQADQNNPLSFYFFTSNIENGINKGIDLSVNLKLNKINNLFLNVGTLDTQRDSFSYISSESNTTTINKRGQARSPQYTINAGIESYLTNKLFVRFEVIAKDKYYYFDNTNHTSKAYQICNINTRYHLNNNLSISLNMKNMLNEKYAIHGFYFSLDGYMPAQLYESPGDPKTYGLRIDYKF